MHGIDVFCHSPNLNSKFLLIPESFFFFFLLKYDIFVQKSKLLLDLKPLDNCLRSASLLHHDPDCHRIKSLCALFYQLNGRRDPILADVSVTLTAAGLRFFSIFPWHGKFAYKQLAFMVKLRQCRGFTFILIFPAFSYESDSAKSSQKTTDKLVSFGECCMQ